MGNHIVNGEFQSDKYPTCPPGKVPLSVRDVTAQDLLWEYAQRRRIADAEFADDLEEALKTAGYEPERENGMIFNVGGVPNLSGRWTPGERMAACMFLASVIDGDVRTGRHGKPGRPTAMSVQHVCTLSAEDIEQGGTREEIDRLANEVRAHYGLEPVRRP